MIGVAHAVAIYVHQLHVCFHLVGCQRLAQPLEGQPKVTHEHANFAIILDVFQIFDVFELKNDFLVFDVFESKNDRCYRRLRNTHK
jgi:hypothetical protein